MENIYYRRLAAGAGLSMDDLRRAADDLAAVVGDVSHVHDNDVLISSWHEPVGHLCDWATVADPRSELE